MPCIALPLQQKGALTRTRLQREDPQPPYRSSRESSASGQRHSLAASLLSQRATARRPESASLEGEVLRLERLNVSLKRALTREEEYRNEVEQVLWHSDTAEKAGGTPRLHNVLVNNKVQILEERSKTLKHDLERSQMLEEASRQKLAEVLGQASQPYSYHGMVERGSVRKNDAEETGELLSDLKATRRELAEVQQHDQIMKMTLQATVGRLQMRCSSLQAQLLKNESPSGAQDMQSQTLWAEEKRALVNHHRFVKAQMQGRIDRVTALLLQERTARQNAYDAHTKALERLEQMSIAGSKTKDVSSQMDKYIAELHREMEALRDTVILLQNDNAELVVEHNHVRDLGAQQLRAQQQQVKEQEILFLNHLKSRDLEIERLRVETNQLTAEKEKLMTAPAMGKSAAEVEIESMQRRIEEMQRWRSMSDDSILDMQARLDAQGVGGEDVKEQMHGAFQVIKDLENRLALTSEQLDRERKTVTELEGQVYDLMLSTKTLRSFADTDEQRKSEALQWHEQDQARITELEGMLDSLKGSMNDVECDLGSTRVSTAELELQHKKAVRELEQEIALLRSRNTDSQARSPVSSRTGNKSALIELQSAMESATERSMYFESREAMLVQDKKHLQKQLDFLAEEKMGLEKAQELLLRENAHLKKEQAVAPGLRRHEREAEKDRRIAEAHRKIDVLEVKLKESETDNEKKRRDLDALRDRLLLLDRMKQSSDQNLERERANGENVAILSDMLKECENANRRLETQLKFANDELHEARSLNAKNSLELRESNIARCQAEQHGNELKTENENLNLELFKAHKQAREAGEMAHKLQRRHKDLERENEELNTKFSHLVIESTQHEGKSQAAEDAKLTKNVAKLEAELKDVKMEYHRKVLAFEDLQLAHEAAESARKMAVDKLKELEAKTKDMAGIFNECKDKIASELGQATIQGETQTQKLADLQHKHDALQMAHHTDLATIEEMKTRMRKMDFDLEVGHAQLEQVSQRLTDAMDRNASLQVAVSKLEEENGSKAKLLVTRELELTEAQRMQQELQKNLTEEKVGGVGSTNIAWQKLEVLAKEKAACDDQIESLKKELEESLEVQEKVMLNARDSERTWAQNCRELEGHLDKLKNERHELCKIVNDTQDIKREDDETIDAIATELQNARKHARDMELQKESIALEMSDSVELSKRLTEELDEVRRQCDLRDIKIDQLLLELEEKSSEEQRVRVSIKSMGEVAQNQQAQITLLQAEREKDAERLQNMADQELMKAKEQIAALERELERVHNQRQFSVSTKGSEQEQALMTARLAKEEYEELKMSTEDKIKAAVKQLEVEHLAKLQLEYCVAELEVQIAKDRADFQKTISEERRLHDEEHNKALDLLKVCQVKQHQLLSVQRRTVYNVVDQRARRTLTRFFDKWCLQKNAIIAVNMSMGICMRRWSDREVMRSFCSWASLTLSQAHLRYVAMEVARRHGRNVKRACFCGWLNGISSQKRVESGVDTLWCRKEKRLKTSCLKGWSYQTTYVTRSYALLRWAHQRAEFYLKSVAFHAMASNSFTEQTGRAVDDARRNYEELAEQCVQEVLTANERAKQVLAKQNLVSISAAKRMSSVYNKRLCSSVWRHWFLNTKNSKRLGIVAATVLHRMKFRSKQRHMLHWLWTSKAATRLWLEGENAIQKLHYRRRHQVLEFLKSHLLMGKVIRRLTAHVSWTRNRKRKLDGFDAFAGQLIKRGIKTHVEKVEKETAHKVERLAHENKTKEERAARQMAQIERESSAKVEESERRASLAERELKKTSQMLSDSQQQARLLEESIGDGKADMLEQIKSLSAERQFAEHRYEETAEQLRQKEGEVVRVETLLAEAVKDSRRHTELYEQGQGQIHELTIQMQELAAKLKDAELAWKSEKVDMEMFLDKQLALAKSDHLDKDEEIARLRDKVSLLEEGLKASGETSGNTSSKLVHQIDELQRKCTDLQDDLTRTKQAATGKGSVALRLLKAAHAAASNAYHLKGSKNKHRAFYGWRQLAHHRRISPYLMRYRSGEGAHSIGGMSAAMARRSAWVTWVREVKLKHYCRARAAIAHKIRSDETLEICWGVLRRLLHDRHIRNDYAKAWQSTFSEMEAEKIGAMRLSADIETLRQLLAEEQEAKSVAEHQLEQSLELGEALQMRLFETNAQLNKLKLYNEIPLIESYECRLELAQAQASEAKAEAEALANKILDSDYARLERDNIIKDIDNLTDANAGLKRALDEAHQDAEEMQAQIRNLREALAGEFRTQCRVLATIAN